MKSIYAFFIFLTFFTFIECRYTFNYGDSVNPRSRANLNLLAILTGGAKSDPKLKEGVINWAKDQFDPEIIKTWYSLSQNDRACIQRGLMLAKNKIEEQDAKEAMEFIENYCPNAANAADKLYKGLHKWALKYKKWADDFKGDLPESMKEPAERMNKNAKWIALTNDKEHKEQRDKSLSEVFNALEEMLNAPLADREALARKHAFLAPFLTGTLRDDSIKICQSINKLAQHETLANTQEFAKAFKRFLKQVKTELMDYFSTRQRPTNQLPDDINTKFNDEVGMLYDIVYSVYAAPFAALYEIDTSGETEAAEIE